MPDEESPPKYTKPANDIYLGIVVSFKDKDIRLEPKSPISARKEKGVEYALPEGESVPLGKLSNGVDDLLDFLGTGIKSPEESALPDIPPLKWAYGKLKNASFSIDKFHLKIPGEDDLKALQKEYPGQVEEAPKKYTVALSANWEVDQNEKKESTLFASVTIKSIFVMVSNEKAEEEEEKKDDAGEEQEDN